ncbi:MAG: thioredoxin-disulfide reductase [bacterium]
MSDITQGIWDVVICGGGPAGLTAGLYAVRSGMRALLVEKGIVGGMAATASHVENYPGIMEAVSGRDITEKMSAQAQSFGLEIIDLVSVVTILHPSIFQIHLSNGHMIQSKTVIVAGGSIPKALNVEGEKTFLGKGISYCATCDAPFFKNQKIIVVGGGNTALYEALYLTQFASKVTVIHRRDKLRGDWIVQERALKNPAIEFIWDSVVEKINGTSLVESVTVRNVKTNQESDIETAGVFIFAGSIPQTDIVKNMVTLDNDGYIITDENMCTSMPGIFAAGDCRKKMLRQIVTATNDGAIAAISAYHYIQHNME